MHNTLGDSRINFEKLGTRYGKAENITIDEEIIEGITCYWFFKKGMRPVERMAIYLHGGCFVLGSIRSHQAMVSHLSRELDIPVLFIEYGLAPENPFPSAINEIMRVYRHIVFNKHIKGIVFIGDSAGAGLACSVISRLNGENINKPEKLVMLSPWVDLSCTNNSITENTVTDPVLTREQLMKFTSMYIGSNALSDANPVENMAGKFPPTLILAGSGEILLDDSRSAFAKISERQPKVKLSVYDHQTHVWLLDDILRESSKNAIEEIRKFINDPSGP